MLALADELAAHIEQTCAPMARWRSGSLRPADADRAA
jgi:hypothetical protein